MTQRSMFWADGTGHGGPYSGDELRLMINALAGVRGDSAGVLRGHLAELAVTTTGNNNIRIASGRGIVNGTIYESDAQVDLNVGSPASGTTGALVVLRKDWTLRTVALAVRLNTDGTVTIPDPVTTDGVTWEEPLAEFTITTGGVIGALVDRRLYVGATLRDILYSAVRISREIFAYTEFLGKISATAGASDVPIDIGWVVRGGDVGSGLLTGATGGQIRSVSGANAAIKTAARFDASKDPRFLANIVTPASAHANLVTQAWGFTIDDTSIPTGWLGTDQRALVKSETTGNLFFQTHDGVTLEETDLGAVAGGVYEISGSNDVWRCYRDGLLLATHSTNVPSSTALAAGIGLDTDSTSTSSIIAQYALVDQEG